MFQGLNQHQSPQNQLPSFGQIVSTSLSPSSTPNVINSSQQHPFGSSVNAAGFRSSAAFGSSSSTTTNAAAFGGKAAFGSGSSTSAAGFRNTAAFSSSTSTADFRSVAAFGSASAAGFGSTAAFGSSSSSTNAAGFGSTAAFVSGSSEMRAPFSTGAFPRSSSTLSPSPMPQQQARPSAFMSSASHPKQPLLSTPPTFTASAAKSQNVGSGGHGGGDAISFARVAADNPPAGIFSVKSEKNPFGDGGFGGAFSGNTTNNNNNSDSGIGIIATTSPSILDYGGTTNPFGRSSISSGGSFSSTFSATKAEPQFHAQPAAKLSITSVLQGQSQKSVFSSSHAAASSPQTRNPKFFLNAPADNVFARSQTTTSSSSNDKPPSGILPSPAFGTFTNNNNNPSSTAVTSTGFGTFSSSNNNNNTSSGSLPSTGFSAFSSKTLLSTPLPPPAAATAKETPFAPPATLPSTSVSSLPVVRVPPPPQQTAPSATFSKSVFSSGGDGTGSPATALAKPPSRAGFSAFRKSSSSSEKIACKGGAAAKKPAESAFAVKTIAKVFGGMPLEEPKRPFVLTSASSDMTTVSGGIGLFGKSVETCPSSSSAVSKFPIEMTTSSSSTPPPSSKVGLFGKPERTGTRGGVESTGSVGATDNAALRSSSSSSTIGAVATISSSSRLWDDAASHRDMPFSYSNTDNEEDSDENEPSVAQRAVSSSRMAMDKISQAQIGGRFYAARTLDSKGRLTSSRKRPSIVDEGRYRKSAKSTSEYDLMRSTSRSRMSRSSIRQRQLSEELESRLALVCKGIPPEYNMNHFLRNHFSKYGSVKRITRNLAKNTANILFKDHNSAVRAKQEGSKLAPDINIQMFWHSSPARRSQTSYVDLDSETSYEHNRRGRLPSSRSAKRSLSPLPQPLLPPPLLPLPPPSPPPSSGRRRPPQQQSAAAWMSGEVEEELRLMAGTSDISGDFVQPLERREETEPPTKTTATASIISSSMAVVSSPSRRSSSSSPVRRPFADPHHHQRHYQHPHHHLHRTQPKKKLSPGLSVVPGDAPTPSSVPVAPLVPPAPPKTTFRKRQLLPLPPFSPSTAATPALSTSSTASTDPKKGVAAGGTGATASAVRTYSSVVSAAAAPMTASLFRKSEHVSANSGGFHGDTDTQKANVTISASRVQLLDQRDRLIRTGLQKKSNLATAKALIGTCPDMCPEKERYDREAKRRLHMFEILPGTKMMPYPQVDHARAVKEYSRSSADQEEPLSHELRPGPVLMRTMNYLLSEIGNLGKDGMWAEWFDFLWDRSRGIRKDITQQMMCCGEAVALIEKCVRFHVFASERLCEEDISVFSPNINNENLTKCLQSIKYLYTDLDKKKKLHFDTEAEFRSYMVLMNLNQGDILREVQTLRPEVRNSPEIHFALQVYSALNSNNYIKFFKLARTATFLNLCIIHRYFMQVRSKALRILRKALIFGTKPVAYPLSELVRTLCFESTSEAGTFCKHYGFTVDSTDVLLDRSSFIEPEVAPSLVRAVQFIESKCTRAIGEVINGGPLDPVELPSPTNSFDEVGNLKQELHSKEATASQPRKDTGITEMEVSESPDTSRLLPAETVKPAAPSELAQADPSEETLSQGSEVVTTDTKITFDPTIAIVQQQQKQQQQLQEQQQLKVYKSTISMIKDIAKDLFLEVIAAFARDISQEFVQKSEELRGFASDVHKSISEDVMESEMSEIALEVHTESTTAAATVAVVDEEYDLDQQQQQQQEEEEQKLRKLLRAKKEELERLNREAEEAAAEGEEEDEDFDEEELLEKEEDDDDDDDEAEEEQRAHEEKALLVQETIDRSAMKRQQEERHLQEMAMKKKHEEEEKKYRRAMAKREREREKVARAKARASAAGQEEKQRREDGKEVAQLKLKLKAKAKEDKEKEQARLRAKAKMVAAEKQEEEERKKREVAEEERWRKRRLLVEVTEQMLREHVSAEVRCVAEQQMSDIEKELHERLVQECCQREYAEIVDEVVGELCIVEGGAVYRTDVEKRLEGLAEALYCIQLQQMSKAVECWKRRLLERQRERDMNTFPSWPSAAPLHKQLKVLCGKEHEGVLGDALAMAINRTARLSMEMPLAISRRDDYLPLALTLCHMRRHLIQQKAWFPLDLAATVGPSLLRSRNWDAQTRSDKDSGSLYWKLIMSLPELDEEETDDSTMYSLELSDWLKAKLSKGAKPHSDVDNMSILSLYKSHLEGPSVGDTTLHFCIRGVTGSLTPDIIQQMESEKLFFGTSGLLFVLPLLGQDDDDDDNYWREAQIRLATLLQAKPLRPSIPVAVLMPQDETVPRRSPAATVSLEDLEGKLKLSHFVGKELVSAVQVFALPFQCHPESGFDVEHVAVETVLTNCLKWLATHVPSQPKLEKKYLKDYIEDFLASEFYGPLLYNRGLRCAEGYLQQPPDVIIDFYNSVLEHLTDCATDKVLTTYSWPVTEFVNATAPWSNDLPPIHWNSPEHLQLVGDTLRSLRLPLFTFSDDRSEKWSQAEEDVWNYVRAVCAERSGKSAVELVSRVRHHIRQVGTQFSGVCSRLKYGVSNCPPTYVNMPWVDIILDCINHCLTTMSCLDPRLTDMETATELYVLYQRETLHTYRPPLSWSESAVGDKNMRESCSLESTVYRSIDVCSKELKETLAARKAQRQDQPTGWGGTNANGDDDRQMAEAVKVSIVAERAKSDGFESFLMQSLVAGELQFERDGWQTDRDWYSEFYPRSIGSSCGGGGDDDDDGGGGGEEEEEEERNVKRQATLDCCDDDEDDDDGSCSPEPRASQSMSWLSPCRGDLSVSMVAEGLSLEDRVSLLRDEIDYDKRTGAVMECLLQSFLLDDNSLDHNHEEQHCLEDCG